MAKGDPILEVSHVVKHFPIKSGILFDREVARVRAVDDCSFTCTRGRRWGWWGSRAAGSRRSAER